MKNKIIIISILVVGVFGYNYWINTPYYSLMQIQKSIDTKDKFLFDKYVDTNEIIEEAVEDLSKIFIEEMDAQESYEYSFLDPQVLTAGLISLFQPAIENAIEEGFEEFWEDEVELAESQTDLKNYLNIFKVSYLERDGKTAKLGLVGEDTDSRLKVEIEFKLNKIDNYWRITQISNLEDLLRQNIDKLDELIDLDTFE